MIEKLQQGRAILLSYDNYANQGKNATAIERNVKLPVGHAAVLLVSPNGSTRYLEYGRYKDNSRGTGKAANNSGNFRRIAVPDMKQGEDMRTYLDRARKSFPYQGHLEATVINNVDTDAAYNYYTTQANNPNRKAYNINPLNVNTCATQARKIIQAGAKRSLLDMVIGGVKSTVMTAPVVQLLNPSNGNLASRIWGLLPGTAQRQNTATEAMYGDEKYVFE